MGRKLYVGNLPYTASEQDLQSLFEGAGTVESVNVMRDMATGRARGFAFVEMSSDDDAQKAIDQFNNASFGGRNLTVNEARPKTPGGGHVAHHVHALHLSRLAEEVLQVLLARGVRQISDVEFTTHYFFLSSAPPV